MKVIPTRNENVGTSKTFIYFDYFKYDIVTNGSKGTFGEELKEKMLRSDYSNPFKRKGHCLSVTEIGMLGISLDTLVYDFDLETPNYLKIEM